MTTFRHTLAVSIAAILSFAFVSQAFADPAAGPEIVLGATIPLSGNAATYGKLIRDGLTLAEEDLKRDGFYLRLVLEDVATPGEPAITALRKMLAVDHIDGVVANFYNGNIPAMAPIIQHSKIPTFHTAIADDFILRSGEYVFSTNGTVAAEAAMMTDYARETLHAKTAAIFFVGTPFGENYAEHFQADFERAGGKVLFRAIAPLGKDDFRTELARVRSLRPDVIIAAHFGPGLGALLKQLGDSGNRTPVVGVYEAEDPSVVHAAGSGAEGMHYFEPEPMTDSEKRAAFRRRFTDRFGYSPRVLAANAYDAAMLMTKAMTRCQKEKSCVLAELKGVQSYDGASGIFSIAGNRAADRPFTLKTYEGGTFLALRSSEGLQLTRTTSHTRR